MEYLLDLLDHPVLEPTDPTGEKRALAIRVCENNPLMIPILIDTTEKRLERAERYGR